MEESFWEPTQAALQGDVPLVRKPKLTEALLKKPPFRFLHDVISEVQRNTGFAPGLYTSAELAAKAIQDKDGKMTYLQKMIDCISNTLGEQVLAKPAKIVAGLEPEHTNTFLQMLARAAAQMVQVYIQQQPVSASTTLQQSSAQAEPDLAVSAARLLPTPPSTDTAQITESAAAKVHHRPTRSAAQPADVPGPTPNTTAGAVPAPASASASAEALPKQLPDERASDQDVSALQRPAVSNRPERPTSARRGPPKLPQTGSSGRPQTPLGSTARPGTSSGRPGSALRSTLPTPPGARPVPGVPVQESQAAAGSSEASAARQMMSSARRVLPGARPASAGLKRPTSAAGLGPSVALVEEGAQQEDDGDVLVVTEALPSTARSTGQGASAQGALVRNILEAEKALQEQVSEEDNVGEPQGTGIVLRRKKRDDGSPSKAGDALAIAELVQKLCQSTNPLARCVEHLQEDLETMNTELKFWAEERQRYQDKLLKQQQHDKDAANSHARLSDLDNQAEAAEQRILSLKKSLLQNDITIQNLLRMQADPLGISRLMSSLNLSESTEVRAVLEHPMPNALNGKWSWFSAGYNCGIWKGVLLSHGIPFETVSAKVWKTDMQLIKAGKEGSRELAQHFLPQTMLQLKRKKDHGRAEALLLAAWGIGVRRTTADVAAANAAAFAELDDTVDCLEKGTDVPA
ncbi:MAG: TRAF3-interacting 1 isoform 2 [Trebouxia sp. A1-2]|nr:MAG: TRAF3-interacting 1 isoform 2 [Trebouxia sp. A1-2]